MTDVDITKLGAMIDEVHGLRKEIEKHNRKISELTEAKDALSDSILQVMELIGTTTATAITARATVSDVIVSDIIDDDEFHGWVGEDPAARLGVFQRRLNQRNLEELRTLLGSDIPGIGSFTKKRVVISKLPNT
jgi:hypothetical protein